jgi:hypothetical protein
MSLSLTFNSNYGTKDYKLFEIGSDLEETLLNEIGSVVHLKGGSDNTSNETSEQDMTSIKSIKRAGSVGEGGHVVLCNDNTTKDVKCSETSNIVLLISENLSEVSAAKLTTAEAVGSTQRTFVLSTAAPRYDHLDAALNEYMYVPPLSSPSASSSSSSSPSSQQSIGVTMDVLCQRVQASREEILKGLEDSKVPRVPGTTPQRWCKLSREFVIKCFDSILSVIETHDWAPTSSVPVTDMVSALEEHYAPWVVEHVLRSFSKHGSSSTTELVGLDIQLTQNFRAQQVLVEAGASNNSSAVSELARDWASRLPDGAHVDGEMVTDDEKSSNNNNSAEVSVFLSLIQQKGLGLVDGDRVRAFFREDLSTVPRVRFQQLFEEREEWCKEDLLPYLVGLEGAGESLLVKYTRGSTKFTKR